MRHITQQILTAACSKCLRLTCRSNNHPSHILRHLSSHPILRPGQKISIDPHAQSKSKRKPAKHSSSPIPFIDRIKIRARAGNGGSGCMSFHRIGSYKKRPSGGHGGKGGNVYLVTDPNVGTLKMDKHHFNATDGGKGGTNGRAGKDGKDVFVRVPVGVVVRRVLDRDEMDLFEDDDIDVDEEGNDVLFDDDVQHSHLNELSSSENDNDTSDETDDMGSDKVNTSEALFEGQSEIDEESTFDEEFEDFDTYYEKLKGLRRNRGHGKRNRLPIDYEDVVNQEVRAEDGMYHWTAPPTSGSLPDEMSDTSYSEYSNERKSIFVADLDQPHTSLLIAKGGKSGVGNQAFASRMHTHNLNAHAAQKARAGEGEITHLELELKLIADVGLVGFPNAGKSSLLSAMSRARPKIASYPFTTLHPLVGTIHYKDEHKIVMADIPGLIDGAAEGRGRGVEFLRHIERTKALVYIVDAASMDGRCPINDLRILGKELKEYGSSGYFEGDETHFDNDVYENYEVEMKRRRREIMNRPSLILANKMDLIPNDNAGLVRRQEILHRLAMAADELGIVCERENILGISAGVTGEGLQVLSKRLRSVLGS